MRTGQELEAAYPWVQWYEPVPIAVDAIHHDYKEPTYYCCRICIANFGIRADELEVKGFRTRGECEKHIEEEH